MFYQANKGPVLLTARLDGGDVRFKLVSDNKDEGVYDAFIE